MTNPFYQASDEGFLADWTGAGLRSDCRDAFLGALPHSGKHAMTGLTPALRAALRAACHVAYRAGYATAIIDTHHRLGVTVDIDALISGEDGEDKVIDLTARRRERERLSPENE